MTVDVVSDLFFGESLAMLTSSKNRWITAAIASYVGRSFRVMQYPLTFRAGSGWLSADTGGEICIPRSRVNFLRTNPQLMHVSARLPG